MLHMHQASVPPTTKKNIVVGTCLLGFVLLCTMAVFIIIDILPHSDRANEVILPLALIVVAVILLVMLYGGSYLLVKGLGAIKESVYPGIVCHVVGIVFYGICLKAEGIFRFIQQFIAIDSLVEVVMIALPALFAILFTVMGAVLVVRALWQIGRGRMP